MIDEATTPAEHVHPLIPLGVQREWRRRGDWGDLTLAKIVESWAQRDPERIAVTGESPLSYAQLFESARRVAGSLRDARLEPGQYLLAILPNSWPGIVTELAASIAGVAFVPRSAQISPTLALNLIDQLDVRGVVLFAGLLERREWRSAIEEMALRIANGPIMIQGEADGVERYLSFDDAVRNGPPSDIVGFVACQPCLVLSTGGTTGHPKSILHCSESLVFAATRFSESLGFTEDEVHVGVAPYGHAGGSVFEMYMPLLHGAKILPIARWQAKPVAETIEKFGGTFLITMGTHVFDMLALAPEDKARLQSVRLITSGAGPDSLFEEGERELGFEIIRVFGFSECPGHAVGRLDDPAEIRLRQDGIPFAGVEYRILDPTTGDTTGPGQTGEYLCRGPNLFMGYAGSPDLTSSVVTSDGFYRSGDLVAQSLDGYVNWMGRTKDIIRRGGLQIDPLEMEGILDQHPKISQVVVVGEPDARLGERAVVVAVPVSTDDEPTLDEICEFLERHGLQKQNLPERLVLIEAIPRTEIGKFHRAEVKRRLVEEEEWMNG